MIDPLYKAIQGRFEALDLDQEVKDAAITSMSTFVARMGDAKPESLQSLPIFLARLENEITRLVAARAILNLATSPLDIDVSPILLPTIQVGYPLDFFFEICPTEYSMGSYVFCFFRFSPRF